MAAENENKKSRHVKRLCSKSERSHSFPKYMQNITEIPEQSGMLKSEESIPKLLVLGHCVVLASFSARSNGFKVQSDTKVNHAHVLKVRK